MNCLDTLYSLNIQRLEQERNEFQHILQAWLPHMPLWATEVKEDYDCFAAQALQEALQLGNVVPQIIGQSTALEVVENERTPHKKKKR